MSSRESPGEAIGGAAALSPEQWLRVQELFGAAVDCTARHRASLLDRECRDDPVLLREVELLLISHERAGLLDDLAERLEAPSRWRSRIDAVEWRDRRVAQYLVQAALGAGGMGWVYKARDERLGRTVALKFLPPHLNADAEAKQRFLQEARAAAALDHPNICAIHEIGETPDGQLFIAMPLYEGQTLQARLEQGPLSVAELATIALQVASGLAKAHEQGIIHRDVKPANVMLLPDGSVKVLDFGVARIEGTAHTGGTAAMGTLGYMSPEQVRSEHVDHRTDVWALGVMMYEMALGTRPFRGENAQAVRAAIVTLELDPVRAQRPDLPIEIDELISGALVKLPQQRQVSMAAIATELASLVERGRYAGVAVSRSSAAASHVHSAGERRRAAVLVSIVSDYVMLVEQHAAAKLETFMSRLRNAAVEVVRCHGGLVNQTFSEEIVALFGVATGHEDDELRAVRAAIELHAQVTELAEKTLGAPVSLRSGVHAGLLVAQRLNTGPRRYAVSGTVVQSAHRLAVLASRNTVLIGPECQRLITPFIDTEAQEPVVLLADEGPVTPYRVVGESGLQTRLEAALLTGLTTYAGRHDELATLANRFAQARSGDGQVVLIVGEAGVGKSRLLHELSSRVIGREPRQLLARCHSYGGGAPYQPFVDILRQSLHLELSPPLRGAEADDVVARVRSIDPALEHFIPLYLHLLAIRSERHPLPRDLRGEHLQQAMPEALAAILTRMAQTRVTVLLLEDWHWSDEGSREALHRLTDMVAQHAMLVVVTSRSEHADPIEWSRLATRVRLAPLDFPSSVSIMQDVLHMPRVADELARPVFERTGGNPFFLEEICRTLLEQHTLALRDGEGVAEGGFEALRLPDTVQAVIRTRLDGLDKDALDVLRVASVIGREFSQTLLVNVTSGSFDVPRALDQLMRAGLIQRSSFVPEVIYRFHHVLTHEVTYESLLGHQRRSWHLVIGRAIERLDPRSAEERAELLAHHFTQAEDWDCAFRHGMRAAARARALSQFADALALLDRVRDCLNHLEPTDVSRLADVLLQQERLCETLGQRGRQQQIVDELIALLAPHGASAQLAQAYLRQGDLLTLLRRFDGADRALSTALRVSHEHGDAALERHALRSMGLLRWHEGQHAAALAITERALAIDRERNDEFAVAGDLANLGMILKSMGEYQRAIASLQEALSIPALAQSPPSLVYALQNLANVYRMLGDRDRVLEYLQRADDIAREHLLPVQRSFHLMAIAHVYLEQGHIDDSLRTYSTSVKLSRRARHADGLVQSLRAFGEVLSGLRRDEEALPCLQEAAAVFAQLEDKPGEMEMSSQVALILERRSAHEEAIAVWERVRMLSAQLGNARTELAALEGIARATRGHVGSTAGLLARLDAALAFAVTLGAADRELALRNSLGILHWERGEYVLALFQYETALHLARELKDHASEGLMLNSVGVTLSRLERHEEACTVLEESLTLNRRTGAQQLEAHALATLGDVNRARGRLATARECFELSLALRWTLRDQPGADRMRQRLADLTTSQET